jgi:hypothetical protein
MRPDPFTDPGDSKAAFDGLMKYLTLHSSGIKPCGILFGRSAAHTSRIEPRLGGDEPAEFCQAIAGDERWKLVC